ncbi:MAG: hypothetical protein NUV57_00475 [archaeon]|nr:hypothetical protein [archaeon]
MLKNKQSKSFSKGQVAIEYLVITGFVLLIAGILFSVALFFFNENSSFAKADAAVSEIVANADWVASLGNGSTVFFEVNIPDNIQVFQIRNKTVFLKINVGSGLNDILAYSKSNLTPATFVTSAGKRKFSATFVDGNVMVSEVV